MTKYYLHNGTEQQGPFDIFDLKLKNINKDTPIWYEGLSDWTTAGEIVDLNELFDLKTPPPFQKHSIEQSTTVTKPTSKKKSTLGIVLQSIGALGLIIIITMIIISNVNNGNSDSLKSVAESYKEKVMTLEEIERSQPTNFLSANGTYKENFWGDKINVSCVITNKATVATYKDAVIRIVYYTKTKTVLKSNDYTIYEIFSPNSSKTVQLKIDNYQNVNSIDWDVISAKSY